VSWPSYAKYDAADTICRYSAHQLTYPGIKISTIDELFEFARCADPERTIRWNIESKINPVDANLTRGVDDFVTLQHQAFLRSGYNLTQITVRGNFAVFILQTSTEF
jgi:hypothetical protein